MGLTHGGLRQKNFNFYENGRVDYSKLVLNSHSGGSVQDYVVFTYDDFQSGQANGPYPKPPNHIVSIREGRWKLAKYHDTNPEVKKRKPPQWEMYDLKADPLEKHNIAHPEAERRATQERELKRLKAKLARVEKTRLKEPSYADGRVGESGGTRLRNRLGGLASPPDSLQTPPPRIRWHTAHTTALDHPPVRIPDQLPWKSVLSFSALQNAHRREKAAGLRESLDGRPEQGGVRWLSTGAGAEYLAPGSEGFAGLVVEEGGRVPELETAVGASCGDRAVPFAFER